MQAIFTDKVALVTGASRGIGADIARELAACGAAVACVATRAENAAGIVSAITDAGGHAAAFGCRVEVAAEVTRLF
ncbi:MAG: SDR family NAD(P)-dependent oxidoreductase, partial [Gammaproteobacteria bacterium]